MNIKNKEILRRFREERDTYARLGEKVAGIIGDAIKEEGIMAFDVKQRVKSEDSLAGKLELKDEKYHALSDITDLLGVRIICFFADDVDRISAQIEKIFSVDKENSVDKRSALSPTAFGYLSVHYVCALKDGENADDELKGKWFEIQIRSSLQHTWAEIEHDLGYKSEFGIPKEIRREFSRVAGLLEIADERFVAIRDNIRKYGEKTRAQIEEGEVTGIHVDLVSLKEFMRLNKPMRSYLSKLAEICGADIQDISPENYIAPLHFLGIDTLEKLCDALEKDEELAVALAKTVLEDSELDILSSTVGLYYLCRAEILLSGATEEKITEFLLLTTPPERAKRQAKSLLKNYAIFLKSKGNEV